MTIGAQRYRFALVAVGTHCPVSGSQSIENLLIMPLAYQLGRQFGGSGRIVWSGGVTTGTAGECGRASRAKAGREQRRRGM